MYSDKRVINLLQRIGVAEWQGQIFDQKLVNRRFSARAVKNSPKTRLLCCQIAKIIAPLWAIAVAERDGI